MGVARALTALTLSALVGCSLAIDASDIDEGCPRGQKLCPEGCVAIDDPAYGCQLSSCTPCRFDNAIPTCDRNQCTVKACLRGWGCDDCSKNVLYDEDHCGVCMHPCGELESCAAGQCVDDPPP